MKELAAILTKIQCCLAKLATDISSGNADIINELQDANTSLSDMIAVLQDMLDSLTKGESCTNPLYTRICNQLDLSPTESSLTSILAKLQTIDDSLNNIEITSDAISITADQINLNTDTVESKLEDLKTLISDAQRVCGDPLLKTLKVDTCEYKANTPSIEEVLPGSNNTTPAGTVKSYSIIILKDGVTITINGVSVHCPQGASLSWEAFELLNQDIIVDTDGKGNTK